METLLSNSAIGFDRVFDTVPLQTPIPEGQRAVMVVEAMTGEQQDQFHELGYVILPEALGEHELTLLRGELDTFIGEIDAEMDAANTDVIGLNHRAKRYFVANRVGRSELLASFVYGDLMASICRSTIGPDAWFFLEQFVVKFAEVGMTFSWHQDSGYLKQSQPEHERPYVTCWCALDDMTEENGTIYVLPYARAGGRHIVDHRLDPETNDYVGYWGDDPGDPVIVPAGSVAVFSSTLLHRSGPNRTDRPRRSYLCQYTAEPILGPGGTPHLNAIPFLVDGEPVKVTS